MSAVVVEWDDIVPEMWVYDPSGTPWRVVSRWSDGTVVLESNGRTMNWARPRGPVTTWMELELEAETVAMLQQHLGATVVSTTGGPR